VPRILIAAVHLPSKVRGSDAMQQEAAREAARDIDEWEERENCANTILIGDVNMNPWDPGMVMPNSLHGVMTKRLAATVSARGGRVFRRERYECFYNPMWGLLGDRASPGASHYWAEAGPDSPRWHMLDQVLLRPSLMTRPHTVQILDHDGHDSLLTPEGVPSKEHVSDHLPILLSIDL
jgi:endonuclease/exonuclease/phosphatase family metal-dependent hydrolase